MMGDRPTHPADAAAGGLRAGWKANHHAYARQGHGPPDGAVAL